jgi:hypothetical protein
MDVIKVECDSEKEMDPLSSDNEFQPLNTNYGHHSEEVPLPTFHAVKIETRVRCI